MDAADQVRGGAELPLGCTQQRRRAAPSVVLPQCRVEPGPSDREAAAGVTEQRAPPVHPRPAPAVVAQSDRARARGDHHAGAARERTEQRGHAVTGDDDPARVQRPAQGIAQPLQLVRARRLHAGQPHPDRGGRGGQRPQRRDRPEERRHDAVRAARAGIDAPHPGTASEPRAALGVERGPRLGLAGVDGQHGPGLSRRRPPCTRSRTTRRRCR